MEFARGVVECFLGALQGGTDCVEVLDKGDEFIVEFAAAVGDFYSMALLISEAPDMGDGAEGGEESGVGNEDDVVFQGFGTKRGIMGDSRKEGTFDGNVHEHEIGSADAVGILVFFRTQTFKMGANGIDMALEVRWAEQFISAIEGLFIGPE